MTMDLEHRHGGDDAWDRFGAWALGMAMSIIATGMGMGCHDKPGVGGGQPARPPEEVQNVLRRLEETDPSSKLPKPVDFEEPLLARSVRAEPGAEDRVIAEMTAATVAAAIPDRLAALPMPQAAPVGNAPVGNAPVGNEPAGKAAAPAALPRSAATPPATPADACRASFAKCDGKTSRTDVCVRDLPTCEGSAGTAGCCPEACLEAYKSMRRGNAAVAAAGTAVFGPAGHTCMDALAQGWAPPAPADAPKVSAGSLPASGAAPLVFPENQQVRSAPTGARVAPAQAR